MAALRCSCRRGTHVWGEFWWVDRKHQWMFFDDEKTSEAYGERITRCSGCGKTLEYKELRAEATQAG